MGQHPEEVHPSGQQPPNPPPDPKAVNPALLDIVVARLETQLGRQGGYSRKGPTDQLIATILSQRTNYADEKLAFDHLKNRFASWEAVATAPLGEVEAAIQSSRFPEVKAPRIQEVLRRIIAEHGSASLDFLDGWPTEKVQEYLMQLPGVGYKTSSFVLLFTLRRPVLPVDTHIQRVSIRTGILPLKTSGAKAHILLLKMLPPEPDELLNFHKLLFKHGQQVCTYTFPKCGQCVLRDVCRAYATGKFNVTPP